MKSLAKRVCEGLQGTDGTVSGYRFQNEHWCVECMRKVVREGDGDPANLLDESFCEVFGIDSMYQTDELDEGLDEVCAVCGVPVGGRLSEKKVTVSIPAFDFPASWGSVDTHKRRVTGKPDTSVGSYSRKVPGKVGAHQRTIEVPFGKAAQGKKKKDQKKATQGRKAAGQRSNLGRD